MNEIIDGLTEHHKRIKKRVLTFIRESRQLATHGHERTISGKKAAGRRKNKPGVSYSPLSDRRADNDNWFWRDFNVGCRYDLSWRSKPNHHERFANIGDCYPRYERQLVKVSPGATAGARGKSATPLTSTARTGNYYKQSNHTRMLTPRQWKRLEKKQNVRRPE